MAYTTSRGSQAKLPQAAGKEILEKATVELVRRISVAGGRIPISRMLEGATSAGPDPVRQAIVRHGKGLEGFLLQHPTIFQIEMLRGVKTVVVVDKTLIETLKPKQISVEDFPPVDWELSPEHDVGIPPPGGYGRMVDVSGLSKSVLAEIDHPMTDLRIRLRSMMKPGVYYEADGLYASIYSDSFIAKGNIVAFRNYLSSAKRDFSILRIGNPTKVTYAAKRTPRLTEAEAEQNPSPLPDFVKGKPHPLLARANRMTMTKWTGSMEEPDGKMLVRALCHVSEDWKPILPVERTFHTLPENLKPPVKSIKEFFAYHPRYFDVGHHLRGEFLRRSPLMNPKAAGMTLAEAAVHVVRRQEQDAEDKQRVPLFIRNVKLFNSDFNIGAHDRLF